MVLFLLILVGALLGVGITYFYGHIPFLFYLIMLIGSVLIAIKIRK